MTSNEYVTVNTKMNFAFRVEKQAILEAINSVFDSFQNLFLIGEVNLTINQAKTNVNISLSYGLKNINDFSFETKKLIFFIEQKVYSLISTKPSNINLIFEGTINNENKN